ncbi:hypothetical protein COT94_02000 [Candidatus Falkowbacteria bacterium CG10_big_fil_rev_8_21_14_0_10_37_14]|uniref:Uncharacterized protein n=1 Tax=Candidatus Falkowbacteria bacterium CG10_big_fil_rev_8_21_14_0_10_37_14 TaxID=1974561 RepID=A0A2M6WTG4_9BACT|nr:hypothetical protein [Candidatus Falkowbacteria bacterium]PIT96016.1 MAG: hypothetical protein COT94_02000 [Candidatus Falkowbacteria bacterium CG10_big_fil_rev_8_21_14_0_10_37_14]
MKKCKYLLSGVGFWLAVNPALAEFGEDTARGQAPDLVGLQGTAANTLAILAGDIAGTLLAFLGTIFFILILYGGFTWMTAAGDPSKAKRAQTIIITAVVGLIVLLSAYAITTFIADNVIPK